MTASVDARIRKAVDDDIFGIGVQDMDGVFGHRVLDLSQISSELGISATSAEVAIMTEGYLTDEKDPIRDWVEVYCVSAPPTVYTAKGCGSREKNNMIVLQIRTNRDKGLYYMNALSTVLEEFYKYNKKLSLANGKTLAITNTYQQPTIVVENSSGRYYNRLFVETSTFYHND